MVFTNAIVQYRNAQQTCKFCVQEIATTDQPDHTRHLRALKDSEAPKVIQDLIVSCRQERPERRPSAETIRDIIMSCSRHNS